MSTVGFRQPCAHGTHKCVNSARQAYTCNVVFSRRGLFLLLNMPFVHTPAQGGGKCVHGSSDTILPCTPETLHSLTSVAALHRNAVMTSVAMNCALSHSDNMLRGWYAVFGPQVITVIFPYSGNFNIFSGFAVYFHGRCLCRVCPSPPTSLKVITVTVCSTETRPCPGVWSKSRLHSMWPCSRILCIACGHITYTLLSGTDGVIFRVFVSSCRGWLGQESLLWKHWHRNRSFLTC
jgi:hypothetical protein